MELGAFQKAFLIDCSTLVDRCSTLLSLITLFVSRNVIVHYFNSFDISNLNFMMILNWKFDVCLTLFLQWNFLHPPEFPCKKRRSPLSNFYLIFSRNLPCCKIRVSLAHMRWLHFFDTFPPLHWFSNCPRVTGSQIFNVITRNETLSTRSLHPSTMKDAGYIFDLWYDTTAWCYRGEANTRIQFFNIVEKALRL